MSFDMGKWNSQDRKRLLNPEGIARPASYGERQVPWLGAKASLLRRRRATGWRMLDLGLWTLDFGPWPSDLGL